MATVALKKESCSCAQPGEGRQDITARHFTDALIAAKANEQPYRHWFLNDVLPCFSAQQLTQLPFEVADISDTYGKRDSHNASRHFFNRDAQLCFPVCRDVAAAFQSPRVVNAIEKTCAVNLQGSSLRIEYCQDKEGFWLEPHTDIGVKIFTMVVYLTQGHLADTLGTDIYDESMNHVGRAPSAFNSAVVFIPGENTWHGFEKRPIPDIRRSLIVNYVKPEWRARHELCFPENTIKR